jgi:hypothetical protein
VEKSYLLILWRSSTCKHYAKPLTDSRKGNSIVRNIVINSEHENPDAAFLRRKPTISKPRELCTRYQPTEERKSLCRVYHHRATSASGKITILDAIERRARSKQIGESLVGNGNSQARKALYSQTNSSTLQNFVIV